MDSIMPHEVNMLASTCIGKLQSMFVSSASLKESSLKHFNDSVLRKGYQRMAFGGLWLVSVFLSKSAV
jgi:hypothetical protein